MDRREKGLKLQYKNHSSVTGERCFYCGAYGDEIDYWPPISQADNYSSLSFGWRIRACTPCNHRLAGSMQGSVEERRALANSVNREQRPMPRFRDRTQKLRYEAMDRVCRAIARGIDDPLTRPDEMVQELIEQVGAGDRMLEELKSPLDK